MLNGIDVSWYQPDDIPALVPNDFCLIKATGGTGYINPRAALQVAAAGARTGLYHFAGDNYPWTTPEAEAAHFLTQWRSLAKEGTIPVLDWEQDGRTHETGWALRWIELVAEATGKVPLLYCNLSVATTHDWSAVQALGVKLWLAMYGDDRRQTGYRTITDPELTVENGWGPVALWQYTQNGYLPGYGNNLDLNIAYQDLWASPESDLIDGVEGVPA